MNKITMLIKVAFFSMIFVSSMSAVAAKDNKKITHVVMVWLKQPGNEQQRRDFVKASRQLNDLPGIIHRHVGIVNPSGRNIADDSFDVAVTVTMKNKAALKAYLNHPKHKRILRQQLKPFIDKAIAYDFIGQ